MSKQHFEMLARVIRDGEGDFKSNNAHARFAAMTASHLAQENPRFDRGRFVMACMPSWMVGTNKANPWERIARAGA